MARFKVCGVFDNGGGMCDILVDTLTGELVLQSDLLGNCYMSELTVLDPLPAPEPEAAEKIMKYFNADGVIMSSRHLITLHGNTAKYRNYVDNSVVEHETEFNTDLSCDLEYFN